MGSGVADTSVLELAPSPLRPRSRPSDRRTHLPYYKEDTLLGGGLPVYGKLESRVVRH